MGFLKSSILNLIPTVIEISIIWKETHLLLFLFKCLFAKEGGNKATFTFFTLPFNGCFDNNGNLIHSNIWQSSVAVLVSEYLVTDAEPDYND